MLELSPTALPFHSALAVTALVDFVSPGVSLDGDRLNHWRATMNHTSITAPEKKWEINCLYAVCIRINKTGKAPKRQIISPNRVGKEC